MSPACLPSTAYLSSPAERGNYTGHHPSSLDVAYDILRCFGSRYRPPFFPKRPMGRVRGRCNFNPSCQGISLFRTTRKAVEARVPTGCVTLATIGIGGRPVQHHRQRTCGKPTCLVMRKLPFLFRAAPPLQSFGPIFRLSHPVAGGFCVGFDVTASLFLA